MLSMTQISISTYCAFDIFQKVVFCLQIITKTHLCNSTPLKPHFYIGKLGFTGVYIIFLISVQNIGCGYSLELPRQGGSNEYTIYVSNRNMKNIRIFSENFDFLVLKFPVYLNRHVFVMWSKFANFCHDLMQNHLHKNYLCTKSFILVIGF